MDSGMVHTCVLPKQITRWKDRGNLLGRECTKEDIVFRWIGIVGCLAFIFFPAETREKNRGQLHGKSYDATP